MKKSLILLLFVAVMSLLVADLTVDIPFETTLVGPEAHGVTENWTSPFFHVTNNGAEGTYFIDLVPTDLPTGWMATWCNEGLDGVPDGCHSYSAPAWEFIFPAGATIDLDFQAIYNTTDYFHFEYVITSDDLAEPLVLPFTFKTADAVSNDDNVQDVSDFGLVSNYPNPFNPTTTISFNLTPANATDAKIEIFNIKGGLVQQFSNLTVVNNSGSVIWNGNDLNGNSSPSGVYYYRLNSGSISETRKMIMVK
ncbi:MAG: T9SS type A sorting domain-containing protein [Candidatus Zophobacter franzmannii]|nr:T9SS type A sorting domain-containing protein [Candidatus Zophobacter franzmannii]